MPGIGDLEPQVVEELGALFAGSPEEFVAGRDRIAAELRAAGERSLAAEIKKLRRPTLAAWALNRVARDRPEIVASFVDAARAVRRAQEHAASADGLRRAIADHREARRALANAASDVLTDRGADTASARDEVATTLDAAALDDSIADALAAGRLERAATASNAFGLLTPGPPNRTNTPKAPRESRRSKDTSSAEPRRRPDDQRDDEREREKRTKRDARILAATSRVDEAIRSVEECEAALDAAEADLRSSRRTLDAAQRDRDQAAARLERARDVERRAQDALDRI